MNKETSLVKDEDLEALINELYERCGHDFSGYARASLKRRVARLLTVDRLPSFAELLYKVKTDDSYLPHVVEEITVNVTEMFRDPQVFKVIRETILPLLATHPIIRIWHAGCASGEEVYSMAIMLEEAGLLHKSLLYATDVNGSVIQNIRQGIFPLSQMRLYSENYQLAGGQRDFSTYYTAKYDWAKFDSRFREKMIVATHNLVADRSFNSFQLIFCRNVLIYFDKDLQNRVLGLLNESLDKLGFLVLGSKENLHLTKVASFYQSFAAAEKIWRKLH